MHDTCFSFRPIFQPVLVKIFSCLLGVGAVSMFKAARAFGAGSSDLNYELFGEVKVVPIGSKLIMEVPFKLQVKGDYWKIITCPKGGVYSETNYHWKVFNVSTGLLAESQFIPQKKYQTVQLKPLIAPVACNDQASHFIWLLLTPSVRADHEGKFNLPPVYDPSAGVGTNPNLRRNCLVEYLDESKSLLKRIRFLNDGTHNSYSNGTNSAVPYQSPYDKGFLEASFEAVRATNWNAITIPISIIGNLFRPGTGRSAEDLMTNGSVEINITLIRDLPAGAELPPKAEPNINIADRRVEVANSQPVTYRISGGPWPDIKTSVAAAERYKKKDLLGRPSPVLKFIVLAALLLPLLCFMIRFVFKRKS